MEGAPIYRRRRGAYGRELCMADLNVAELYAGRKEKRPVLITCAVTGGNDFNRRHPNFPITPGQIADAALEAERAGAAVVHLHVRDPVSGEGSRDPALFRDLVARVRDKGCRALINLTGGGGAVFVPDPEDEARAAAGTDVASAEERIEHIVENRPDLCSIDVTTQNQYDGGLGDHVYLNTPRTLRSMAARIREAGVKPEIEVFAPGDVMLARQMIEEGLFAAPPFFQIVLGTRWGLPATPETLLYMRSLLPRDCVWAAFATGRMQMPMVAQSILAGGQVRVGLEDNLYLERGVFASNGQLVERAVAIIEALGECVASPDDARALLSTAPASSIRVA